MSLNANERELLKVARERIYTRRNRFLCLAMADLARMDDRYHKAYKRLAKYVSKQLGEHAASLDQWQQQNGFSGRTLEQTRLDRIEWIDWMLGEIE